MPTIIAFIVISSLLASVLVVTASMLSSRLSRAEDQFLADDFELELPNPEVPVGDAPPSTV